MRRFIIILVMLFMVLLLSGQAISDLFESDLGKWTVTENVGTNDQVNYGTRNDSLYFDLVHDSTSDNTTITLDRGDLSTYTQDNKDIEFEVRFNQNINTSYAYEDGAPGIHINTGSGHDIFIWQSFVDYFGYKDPGYYIFAYSPLGNTNYTGKAYFHIKLKFVEEDEPGRRYDLTIKGYDENNALILNTNYPSLLVGDYIRITGGVLHGYEPTNVNPEDENIPVKISLDYMKVYPDYSDVKVNKPIEIYGYKDEIVNYHAEDSYTGYPVKNRTVELITGDGQVLSGETDLNGDVSFDVYTMSDEPIDVSMSDTYYNYSGIINVLINEMNVAHIKEVYIPHEHTLRVEVYKEPEYPLDGGGLLPLQGADVTIKNGENIDYLGQTNTQGVFEITDYVNYSGDISINVEKETYRTYEGLINPYMWSNKKNAFGKNNQNNILREANSESMHIVYSVGDSIVSGYSDDFGKYWYVDYIKVENELGDIVTARGTNPTLVKTEDGLIAMWNHGSYIEYSKLTSPWTPIDTVGIPMCWNSEPVLTEAKSSIYKYGAYIEYTTWPSEKGDLIFGKWLDEFIDYMDLETVLKSDGSINNIIPMASPLVSAYMKDIVESYLVGCISTDNEYIAKLWDPTIPEWEDELRFISLTDQMAMSPSVDFDGYNSTFVWEVDNQDGTIDIWGRKLTPYGMTQPGIISVTDGINTYPINKDDILYSYVNNGNKLIGYRDGFSSPEIPNSYEVYTSSDSIHSIDVNTKKRRLETDVLYAFTEGKNGNYRINFINKTYGGEVWPIIVTPPTDTAVINAVSSPISDYTNGNFPVERLSFTAPVLAPDINYLVKIITDDKNPVIPQIVMIDGEVVGVVYGGNEEKVTTIEVPQLLTENGSITISIDRKKGNPNRNTKIQLYDYETDEEEINAASLNQIVFNKPQAPDAQSQNIPTIDYNLSTTNLFYSIPKNINVNINIFDITGRVVDEVYNGIQTKGQHTYKLKNKTTGVYFAVMEAEGQTYKTKIINIR